MFYYQRGLVLVSLIYFEGIQIPLHERYVRNLRDTEKCRLQTVQSICKNINENSVSLKINLDSLNGPK